jgi:hypothetical protein
VRDPSGRCAPQTRSSALQRDTRREWRGAGRASGPRAGWARDERDPQGWNYGIGFQNPWPCPASRWAISETWCVLYAIAVRAPNRGAKAEPNRGTAWVRSRLLKFVRGAQAQFSHRAENPFKCRGLLPRSRLDSQLDSHSVVRGRSPQRRIVQHSSRLFVSKVCALALTVRVHQQPPTLSPCLALRRPAGFRGRRRKFSPCHTGGPPRSA